MGDYYQGIVVDYLRADRALFINTECIIQIEPGAQPPKGTSWICDAVVADFKARTVFLCEVTYSETLQALIKRLNAWNNHWKEICEALADEKYNNLPRDWAVKPWLFVPESLRGKLQQALEKIRETSERLNFEPKITSLEAVQPWKFREGNRIREEEEPSQLEVGMPS